MSEMVAMELGAGDVWGKFTIGGHEFDCEVWDGLDRLRQIELRHKDDANECQDCGAVLGSLGEPDRAKCSACGSDKVRSSILFLDDVASLLRTHYGCTRVSLAAAGAFYGKLIELSETAKKNS